MIYLKIDIDKVNYNEEEVEDIRFVELQDLNQLIQDCESNKEHYTPWFLPSLIKVKNIIDNK